jgi:hypothetical protein
MDDKSAVSVSTSVYGGEIFFNKSKKKFISEKLGPLLLPSFSPYSN